MILSLEFHFVVPADDARGEGSGSFICRPTIERPGDGSSWPGHVDARLSRPNGLSLVAVGRPTTLLGEG